MDGNGPAVADGKGRDWMGKDGKGPAVVEGIGPDWKGEDRSGRDRP